MQMNKGISLLLLTLSFILLGNTPASVYAEKKDQPAFEEFLFDIGYKSPQEAMKEAEQHFKQELKLPLRIPPIAFTHCLGRLTDLDGDINDSFEILFINEKSTENHYSIYIRQLENKIPFKEKDFESIFTLKNGQKAGFIIERNSNFLVFEKGNWQYMLKIDQRIADKVTPEMLVDMANSIED